MPLRYFLFRYSSRSSVVVGAAIFGLNCWALPACFIIFAKVLFYGDLFMHGGDVGGMILEYK